MIVNARNKSDQQIENESQLLKQPLSCNNNNNNNNNNATESQEIAGLNQDFQRIVDSMRVISTELNPKKATPIISEQTCKLLQCDHSILYTFDAENETVSVNSEESLKDLKFPASKGIIGRCIKNGKYEIIEDIKKDNDYDSTIDKILKISTKNILCCPLKDFETGEVYAIIQALNKHGGNSAFSDHDVDLLNAIGHISMQHLQNGIIYEMASAESVRNQAMIDLWSHLHDDTKVYNINSLLFTIRQRCLEIVDAEKCTFYFVDHQNQELWSMQGEVNIKMPINKGMAGLCATTGNIVNEENVYKNEKFDKKNDEKTGFITKSMLCVPMKTAENKVIGVIQLMNKRGVIDVFDESDEKILQLVLSAAAPIIEQNQLFVDKESPKKDEKWVDDFDPNQQRRPSLGARNLTQDIIISAVVEEEEEEQN